MVIVKITKWIRWRLLLGVNTVQVSTESYLLTHHIGRGMTNTSPILYMLSDILSMYRLETTIAVFVFRQLQMLLFPSALCCSLYERNCVCAVTKIFTKFLPANNFCQLLRVTRKRSCTSAGNAQAQLHFQDDQQRAFGISNLSNWILFTFAWRQYIRCVWIEKIT